MIRSAIVLLALFSFAACSGDDQAPSPGAESQSLTTEIVETYSGPGQQAYVETCSKCHDDGVDGAPRIGHPEDWEGRSQLWEAVLFEHAKTGYLDMPAKGGDETLTDATVTKAAEYMLRITFPDIPRD